MEVLILLSVYVQTIIIQIVPALVGGFYKYSLYPFNILTFCQCKFSASWKINFIYLVLMFLEHVLTELLKRRNTRYFHGSKRFRNDIALYRHSSLNNKF